MFISNRKGQNVAEYAVLIALVIAAAVAMQTYVKRALQAHVKDGADIQFDNGGVQGLTFQSHQYEPYYTDASSDVRSGRDLNEQVGANGQTTRTGVDEGTTRLTGSYERSNVPQWDTAAP